MRRRLIQSTLAVVLVVIAVFGVSLVIVETRTISNSAQERVDSEAIRLAGIVDSRLFAAEDVTGEILRDQVAQERYAVIRIPGRDPIEVGTRLSGEVISSTQEGEEGETVTVPGHAEVVEYLGNEELLHVTAFGQDIVAIVDSDNRVKPGDVLQLLLPYSKLHLFDAESGASLTSDREAVAA